MKVAKAPFNRFNPKGMKPKQKARMRAVYASFDRREAVRFFTWTFDAKGKADMVFQTYKMGFAMRRCKVGPRGGLIYKNRYVQKLERMFK